MMKSTVLTASLAVAAATAFAPKPAHAYDVGDALIACASNNLDTLNRILDGFMTSCDLTKGRKNACTVVKGDPWTCNDKLGPTPLEDQFCYGSAGSVFVEITASTSIPGWTVTGKAKAELTHYAKEKKRKECDADPKTEPPADGRAGEFISYASVLEYYVNFKVDGEITVDGGQLGKFTIKAGGSCTARRAAPAYQTLATDSCEASDECNPDALARTDMTQRAAPTFTMENLIGDPTVGTVPEVQASARAICVVVDEPIVDDPDYTDIPDDYFDPADYETQGDGSDPGAGDAPPTPDTNTESAP
jgi:hypothetical protein